MNKDFLTLARAAAHFPSRPHVNTVKRWATKGIYGVKLRTIRYGGKRLTCLEWIEEFNSALIGRSSDHNQHGASAASVEKKLDALGIL